MLIQTPDVAGLRQWNRGFGRNLIIEALQDRSLIEDEIEFAQIKAGNREIEVSCAQLHNFKRQLF